MSRHPPVRYLVAGERGPGLPPSSETTPEATTALEKPALRGWLHAFIFPVSVVLGLILVGTAPTTEAKVASAIFAVSAVLLFGVSALLHRGSWSPRVEDVLRRMDHSNIYLIIAGTYTPFAVLALPEKQGRTLLVIVWTGAIAGVLLRVFWTSAPRWLTTLLYVVVGWIAVFFLPGLLDGAGVLATSLIILGGVLYTIGAIVYATKRPNPSAEWFGFHEIFHTFTVAAFATHYVAVWIVVHA